MTRFPLFHAFSCSLLALASQSLGWQISGESVPAVPQEFRAAWISTVHNIDWPSRSGLSGAAQRAELLNILNTWSRGANGFPARASILGMILWLSPFRRLTAAALNCTPGSTHSGQRPTSSMP